MPTSHNQWIWSFLWDWQQNVTDGNSCSRGQKTWELGIFEKGQSVSYQQRTSNELILGASETTFSSNPWVGYYDLAITSTQKYHFMFSWSVTSPERGCNTIIKWVRFFSMTMCLTFSFNMNALSSLHFFLCQLSKNEKDLIF